MSFAGSFASIGLFMTHLFYTRSNKDNKLGLDEPGIGDAKITRSGLRGNDQYSEEQMKYLKNEVRKDLSN